MIGFELDVDYQSDAVYLTFCRDGETYEIDMSVDAFDAFAKSMDMVLQRGAGYYGHYAFDVDDDD